MKTLIKIFLVISFSFISLFANLNDKNWKTESTKKFNKQILDELKLRGFDFNGIIKCTSTSTSKKDLQKCVSRKKYKTQ